MPQPLPLIRSAVSLLVIAFVSGVLLPSVASARIESLRWQESSPSAVAGFRVYTRDVAGSFGVPAFDGLPGADSSGVYQFDLAIADSLTVIVAVTAYDVVGNESVLSNELQYDGLPPASPDPGDGGTGLTTYRVNAGGTAYTDSIGNAWEADSVYVAGGTPTYYPNMTVSGTPDPFLYQSNRYDNDPVAAMSYEFPVPDGTYRVRLHVVETWDGLEAGQRVYDVQLEGSLVLDDFDMLVDYPQWGEAMVHEFTVAVTDGSLSVQFDDVVLYPTLSALEIDVVSAGDGSGTGSGGTTTPDDESGGTTTPDDGSGSPDPDPDPDSAVMGAPGQPQLVTL